MSRLFEYRLSHRFDMQRAWRSKGLCCATIRAPSLASRERDVERLCTGYRFTSRRSRTPDECSRPIISRTLSRRPFFAKRAALEQVVARPAHVATGVR
ncbi:hypothetical protein MRX96_005733 [Rhipicephalus microplus]